MRTSWPSAGLAGLGLLVGGLWAWTSPGSFAEFVRFDEHTHFLHDLGAFQIGAGVTLLLAIIWADALATALTGFLVLNTLHAINHIADADLGGSLWQTLTLSALSLLVLIGVVLRLRELGLVLGRVRSATVEQLRPFVRQKTILLTTYRKDGRAGSTPVSIAVEDGHAYFRCPGNSLKAKRLRRDPSVRLAPATTLGKARGDGMAATARRLDGAEARHAARLLAAKYPMLHGVAVPLLHKAFPRKYDGTAHFAVTPLGAKAPAATGESGRC